jgi:hypothetical protein
MIDSDTPSTPRPLRPDHEKVIEALSRFGALTDAEISDRSGIPIRSASPRRSELVKMGLVECVGTRETGAKNQPKTWDLVPAERVEAAREAAARAGVRRRPVTSLPIETRLELLRQLLADQKLNTLAMNQSGNAWRRVRGRARDQRTMRKEQLRQVKAEIDADERERTAPLEFLKLKRNLMNIEEVVRSIQDFVNEDLDRRAATGETRIPVESWPEVADLLTDFVERSNDTRDAIRDAMGELGDDVIEAEIIDAEILELEDGAEEA